MNALLNWGGYATTVAGLLGLIIGSFLNVVVYRVPAGKSLIPGSRCPRCDEPIKPWQNVPVLSWLILRGKCVNCAERISLRYPLVELGTGVFFAGVTWWWFQQDLGLGTTVFILMLISYLYFAAVTIALALIDLDTFRLPNAIVLPSIAVVALLIAVAATIGAEPAPLLQAFLGAVVLTLFYALIWFLWPGGMGLGDVKLAALIGLMLGWLGWGPLLVGAFAAFLFGGIFGLALMCVGRAGRGSRIPFGPWMLAGAWAGIFGGHWVTDWYISTFFAS